MPKRKWNEVVDNAIKAFRSNDYVYLYGAKNVRLTSEAQIRQYFASEPAYFSRYTEAEKAQIIRNSLGHMAADCSGFTGWVCTGDQQYSIGQIGNCSKYNTLAAGPTGSILFTTWGGRGRHIGIDAGNGWTLQAGWESTDKAILEGRAGIILSRISDTAWERSGESNFVDYTGAFSPYPPTTQLIEDTFGPTTEIWIGEAYGASLVPVYTNPDGKDLLPQYPYLATGNLFEVHDETTGFFRIWIAGKYAGWIEKRYCLRKTPQRTGTVTTDLHLRQNAGAQYKSLKIMPAGTVVQICDEKPASTGRPWYYIIIGGIYGFASAAYIK